MVLCHRTDLAKRRSGSKTPTTSPTGKGKGTGFSTSGSPARTTSAPASTWHGQEELGLLVQNQPQSKTKGTARKGEQCE